MNSAEQSPSGERAEGGSFAQLAVAPPAFPPHAGRGPRMYVLWVTDAPRRTTRLVHLRSPRLEHRSDAQTAHCTSRRGNIVGRPIEASLETSQHSRAQK